MKKIKALIKEKGGITYEATLTFNRDITKEELQKEGIRRRIIEIFQENYKNAKTIDLLIACKPKIAKDRLIRIGQEIASEWGAVCTGIKTYENLVTFECNKYGEKFESTMSYEEIEEDYGYVN